MDILGEIAKGALIERDFIPDFDAGVMEEVSKLEPPKVVGRDLTKLMWISIDNDDSLDLDQLTYAEGNVIYVAVADVDSLVAKGSKMDERAMHNTTSIYTPTEVFPMLHPRLSTDLTSLNAEVDRRAIVVEMTIGKEGSFTCNDIYPAVVRNHAKLAYNAVTEWLKQKPATVDQKVWEQLVLQDEIAQKIKAFRIKQGALQFQSIELLPVLQGVNVVDLKKTQQNRAQELIENFMIAANSCMTQFLQKKNLPILKRIVREPKRWDRIVELALEYDTVLPDQPNVKAIQNLLMQHGNEDLSLALIKLIGRGEYVSVKPHEKSPGHFDLALQDYAHTTAPNRRFPDLVMQRIAKSAFENKPLPYTDEELEEIGKHCTIKEDDAQRVERRVMKSAAAMVLSKSIGKIFPGMITGNNEKGVWVRIEEPPVEGKLISGPDGLDVGDKIQVKLVKTDVQKGFIDFQQVKNQ